jgi:hypothetical protein
MPESEPAALEQEPEQQAEPTPEPQPEPAAEPELAPEPLSAPALVAEHALPEAEEHIELTAVPFDDHPDHGSASVASLIKKRATVEPEPETAPVLPTAAPARVRPGKRRTQPAAASVATDDLVDTTDSDQHQPDTAAATGSETETETDIPGFVQQARRRERMGRTMRIIMTVGSILLTGVLLLQGMTTYRNQLAAQVPQLKPVLVAACATLGCSIDLPAQIDMLSVEQGELQSLSETTFSYATVLRNQSGSAQAWPSIELVLNDGADRPVLRRVLAPSDYVASAPLLASGFAARSEQPVRLHFSLAGVKASGYHIAIFYP